MTTQERIALASTVVAAISLLANIAMASVLYRLNRGNATRDVALTVLKDLLHGLEASRLFEIDPEQEIWEFGFDRLNRLANLCPPAITAAGHKRIPRGAQSQISDLCGHVKKLRSFQDSYRQYKSERSEREATDWRALQKGWPDFPAATVALSKAQPVAESCKETLSHIVRD